MQNISTMNEHELVLALIKGEESAYREVVNNYQIIVFNTCLGMLHDSDAAKDISQDVFIELFRSIHKFRGDSKLSTWLYRISINKSLNYIRDNKKYSFTKSIQRFFISDNHQDLEIEDYSVKSPLHNFEQQEHAAALHKAIEGLNNRQKTAFVLKNYDDLSYKQIADVMKISLSSVESLIHRARLNLQKSLQDYYYTHFQDS